MEDFESPNRDISQPADRDAIHSSHNVLAKYLDAFINRTGTALRESVRDIETGVMRLSAFTYPTATFGYYTDPRLHEYSELVRHEDIRMIYSLWSLIRKPDVIYEMTYSIVNFIFLKMPERKT